MNIKYHNCTAFPNPLTLHSFQAKAIPCLLNCTSRTAMLLHYLTSASTFPSTCWVNQSPYLRFMGIWDRVTVGSRSLKIQNSEAVTAAAAAKLLQSCPTLWDPRRQPTRLTRSWDSPGRNTEVGSCYWPFNCQSGEIHLQLGKIKLTQTASRGK